MIKHNITHIRRFGEDMYKFYAMPSLSNQWVLAKRMAVRHCIPVRWHPMLFLGKNGEWGGSFDCEEFYSPADALISIMRQQ